MTAVDSKRSELRDEAKGRWRAILPQLGVPAAFLNGKQHACPICGGKDRARFDDLEGNGTWFCNVCGAGDGASLAMKVLGVGFVELAARVRAMLPDAPLGKGKPARDDTRCLKAARQLWMSSVPIAGTMAEAYLRSRDCWSENLQRGETLRFIERCRQPGDGELYSPAMIARVADVKGNGVNVHRTFLDNGQRTHRAMMPGPIPPGAAIRFGPPAARIGIAEGIETALRAASRFGVTTWATVTAGGMERWEPPVGVEHVDIFGDHDRSFTGQAAAFALAKRMTLRTAPVGCDVHIPGLRISADALDTDWADEQAFHHDRCAA